jgi:hypothetical protein
MEPTGKMPDTCDAALHDRFARLPGRIRFEDMIQERPATVPDPARDTYDATEWLVRYCL